MDHRLLIAVLSLCLVPSLAWPQGSLLQGGPWTPGHVPQYVGQGTGQAVVRDGGGAGGGPIGSNASELGLVARGTGTPPYSAQGTGPFGSIDCLYDAPITNPTGYHFLCLSPNSTGGNALLSYGARGAATPGALNLNINGTTYGLPSTGAGSGNVTGPVSSTVGHLATWANTVGTLLADSPTLNISNNPVVSLVPSIVNNAGAEGGLFLSVPGLAVDITTGTPGAPITAAGPSLHVARTENVQISTCSGIFNNNECNAAIYGFSQNIGGGSGGQQLTGVMGGALTYSALNTGEAVGVQGLARAVGVSVAGVAGGYFEGRYDSTAARSYYYTVGVEARSNNLTGVDAVFDTVGGNSFNSVLATNSPLTALAAKTNGAFLAAIDGNKRFNAGLILTTGCCDRGIWMSEFNANQAYFGSAGANDSDIVIDNLAGGNQSRIDLQDAGTTKWQIGKAANNTFFVYDFAASRTLMSAATGGPLIVQDIALVAAAPTVAAAQIGLGSTVAASSSCGSLASAAGCMVINVAGTTRYVPFY